MDRRDALGRLGLGAASVVVLPSSWTASSVASAGTLEVDRLAEEIAAASFDDALSLVARRQFVRRGSMSGPSGASTVDPRRMDQRSRRFAVPGSSGGGVRWVESANRSLEQVFHAIFQAGVLEVRPTPVDGKIHAVLVVPTVRMSRQHSMRGAWIAAVWCVAAVKRAQALDSAEGDWKLRRRSESTPANLRVAMATFDDAMTRWDAEAADAAVTGVLQFIDAKDLFHALWTYGARCFVNQGQKILLTAQVHRHIGSSWSNDERALRWLVQGLLYTPDAGGPQTKVYARSRRRMKAFPVDWQDNEEQPEQSADVLRELRGGASFAHAQDVVVAAFRRGLGPETVWDGLALYASELALRRPETAAALAEFELPLIEVDALRFAFRQAWHPITRKLMILQAAGWSAVLHARAVAASGPLTGVGIDQLGTEGDAGKGSLRKALETRSPALLRVRLDEASNPAALLGRELDEFFLPRCTAPLQYQYAFAAFREAERVAPRWQSRILAPIVRYIPAIDAEETEAYLEAREASDPSRTPR